MNQASLSSLVRKKIKIKKYWILFYFAACSCWNCWRGKSSNKDKDRSEETHCQSCMPSSPCCPGKLFVYVPTSYLICYCIFYLLYTFTCGLYVFWSLNKFIANFISSFQYVGYADGLIRAYNIHTYAVLYTLQRKIWSEHVNFILS